MMVLQVLCSLLARARPLCSAGTLALACAVLLTGGTAHASGTIHWHVENPFRLFVDPADTALHRKVLNALEPGETGHPVLAAERRLGQAFARGWAQRLYRNTCWSSDRQRYICPGQENYAQPKSHRVVARLAGAGFDGQTCTWHAAPIEAGRSRLSASPSRQALSCDEPFIIDAPYPSGLLLAVHIGDRTIAETEVRVRDFFIVGIGDSYASGDGNPDAPVTFNDRYAVSYQGTPGRTLDGYPARAGSWTDIGDGAFLGEDAGWLSPECHRSLYGHQLRAALQLSLEDPHRAITFATFACWGHDIVNGIFLPREATPIVPDPPRLSQLSAVAALQCGQHQPAARQWAQAFDVQGRIPELTNWTGLQCPKRLARPIDLLLVTVGGNDIGFSQLVANAILADQTPLRKVSGWLGEVATARKARGRLKGLTARLKALNRALRVVLHIPWSQSARIVFTAYPPVALKEDGSDACPSGPNGMTVMPDFALDQQRARENEEFSNELHAHMRRIAQSHGWTFVDGHRRSFMARGICAGWDQLSDHHQNDPRLPRYSNGVWSPYLPSLWRAYASRQRWIRTPNDGYLTVNFHVGEIGNGPINLLLASIYSGAFHPTAEGQAAIADAVVDKARFILE